MLVRAWVALVVLIVLVGCSPARGRPTKPGEKPNFIVFNEDGYHDVTVYVDGAKIGSVEYEAERGFFVSPGRREVALRSGNDLNARHVVGRYDFTTSEVVTT